MCKFHTRFWSKKAVPRRVTGSGSKHATNASLPPLDFTPLFRNVFSHSPQPCPPTTVQCSLRSGAWKTLSSTGSLLERQVDLHVAPSCSCRPCSPICTLYSSMTNEINVLLSALARLFTAQLTHSRNSSKMHSTQSLPAYRSLSRKAA